MESQVQGAYRGQTHRRQVQPRPVAIWLHQRQQLSLPAIAPRASWHGGALGGPGAGPGTRAAAPITPATLKGKGAAVLLPWRSAIFPWPSPDLLLLRPFLV